MFISVCAPTGSTQKHFNSPAMSSRIRLKYENTTGEVTQTEHVFLRGTEAALTSTATHWSPAVQHWSLCVFWCTGPECDVISLLRQKRQARSPPPGHWPLTWTGELYVIMTEWLSQTSSVDYSKSKSSVKKLWSQDERTWGRVSGEGLKGLDGKTETSTALNSTRLVINDGPRWQWTRCLHCHPVSSLLCFF